MRKLIAAINMTIDGNYDHTAVIATAELHHHYTDLLNMADTILYGRVTYQLMEYWRTVVNNPSGNAAMDQFAYAIDRIQKIVFSHTLKSVDWATASITQRGLEEEVTGLKCQPGRDILVGSPGLIVSLLNLRLVDELQLCIHPVIAGNGPHLFQNINGRTLLKLVRTKNFENGAILLCYEPTVNTLNGK